MRLSIVSTAIAAGILWGSGILLVGLVNLARPEYGTNFLMMMNSVYPWFHSSHTISSVIVGTVDGVLDGIVAGCLFGWLYNLTLSISEKAHRLEGGHV